MGSRGLSKVDYLLVGSNGRFVVEKAPCDVWVIKKDGFPAESHANAGEVKKEEEEERKRRLNEVSAERQHQADAKSLAHRVVVLAAEDNDEHKGIEKVTLVPHPHKK